MLKQPLAIEHRRPAQNDGPSNAESDGHREDTKSGNGGGYQPCGATGETVFVSEKFLKVHMIIMFEVPGEPVAKGRAKVTTISGHARMYTPTKTLNYESKVALFASQAMGAMYPLTGPVSLTVKAVFQVPASWSKKRKAANLQEPEYVTKRPDFDNLVKAICDGINGIVWVDDCQVAAMGACSKVYGESPRVEVVVGSLS